MATIKRIAPHVITHCTFCKSEGTLKVLSVWRMTHSNATACLEHHSSLLKLKHQEDAEDSREMSEADHQTWGRL